MTNKSYLNKNSPDGSVGKDPFSCSQSEIAKIPVNKNEIFLCNKCFETPLISFVDHRFQLKCSCGSKLLSPEEVLKKFYHENDINKKFLCKKHSKIFLGYCGNCKKHFCKYCYDCIIKHKENTDYIKEDKDSIEKIKIIEKFLIDKKRNIFLLIEIRNLLKNLVISLILQIVI